MKVVHNSRKAAQSAKELLEQARELEKAGVNDEAIDIYKELIRLDDTNEQAYDRLMILYRKEKEYKKELSLIKSGIKRFEEKYKSSHQSASKKVTDLSRALLRSTGLADKKGRHLYEREPIGRWNRRLKIVEKKAGS